MLNLLVSVFDNTLQLFNSPGIHRESTIYLDGDWNRELVSIRINKEVDCGLLGAEELGSS